MSIFSKAKVKTAVQGRTNIPMTKQHITTADFLQMNCAYIKELVPGQHFELDVDTFARLTPVAVPTLGDCDIKHHAFFVPFRTIMPSWSDFITDTPHQESNSTGYGIVPFAHRLSIVALSQELVSNPDFVTTGTQVDFDLVQQFGSGAPYTTNHYKLTPIGKQLYKILLQLGYQYEPNQTLDAQNYDIYVSALPLLAYMRVFLDWYYPSSYVGDSDYSRILSVLKRDPVAGYTLSSADIAYIYRIIAHVSYDNDYFTSAFDNPAGPNQGLYSSFDIPDITTLGPRQGSVSTTQFGISTQTSYDNGTPVISSSSYNNQLYNSNISKYILDSLHALSDYMKRHQLVGSRSLERFLARFGVSLGTEKTDRSYHLGTYVTPVQFGAVMSNADTTGSTLGSYAGQGYSANFNNNGHFVVDTNDDFGFIMVMTSIVPRIGYVEGINRHIKHVNKLDFFTPEFDALGTQPISNAELYCDCIYPYQDADGNYTDYLTRDGQIFGFTPRYAEYKCEAQDSLTGDFRLARLSQSGDTSSAWHMFRLFDTSDGIPTAHTKQFMMPRSTGDYAQYDRIFHNTTDAADHFILIHRFRINTSFPGKSLYDTYDFDNEKGKQLLIDAGGVKMN